MNSVDEANITQLWVFAPDMRYCSSVTTASQPKRAMKVMYQSVKSPSKTIENSRSTVDEIQFPAQVLNQIQADLEKSNLMIPASARKLQEWHVGFLDRFGPIAFN